MRVHRWVLWLALVLGVATGLSSSVLRFSENKQITGEDYEKIKIGMTIEEVKAVFGREPDGIGTWPSDYRTLDQEFCVWTDHSTRCKENVISPRPGWKDFIRNSSVFDGNTVGVTFDLTGRVNGVRFATNHVPPGVIERIRNWIRTSVPNQ